MPRGARASQTVLLSRLTRLSDVDPGDREDFPDQEEAKTRVLPDAPLEDRSFSSTGIPTPSSSQMRVRSPFSSRRYSLDADPGRRLTVPGVLSIRLAKTVSSIGSA